RLCAWSRPLEGSSGLGRRLTGAHVRTGLLRSSLRVRKRRAHSSVVVRRAERLMSAGRAPQQDDSDQRPRTNVHGDQDEVNKRAGDLASKETALKLWIREVRIHQWPKNLLVFVPLLASHRIGKPGALVDGLIAFVLFNCCASSAYILNDLIDLSHDRLHPYRSRRPFA